MKNVLLISINRCKQPYPVYPLGMSHIAASLKNAGYQVRLFDIGIDSAALETAISEFKPDYIGISMRNIDDVRIDNTVYFIPDLNDAMKRIRSVSSVPVILGGSAFSLFPDRILELSGADYGVVSEGEEAIVALLNLLETTRHPTDVRLKAINGLTFRLSDLSIRCNPTRSVVPSSIPMAFRDSSIEPYYITNSGTVNIQTQRGCPCTCCYCTYPVIEGPVPRFRSAEQVVEEFIDSKRRGNSYFFIVDSVFNTSTDHVTEICEELLRKEVNVKWGCFLRPSNLTEPLMALMARAGLKHIEFGSDSFCDSVLKEYSKDFTFNDIYNASEWARLHKVHYAHFLITGGPGETEATMREAFNNSLRLKKTVIFPFTGMRLFRGTALYDRALKEKCITKDTDLLEPFFYVSPLVTKERIAELLKEFKQKKSNWIIEDLSPEIIRIMNGLRTKGIPGPLWEFIAQ